MPLNKSLELKRKRLSNANRQSDDFVSIGEPSAIDSATQEVDFTIECEIELSSKYSTDGVDSATQEAETIIEYEPDLPSKDLTDGKETESNGNSAKFRYK